MECRICLSEEAVHDLISPCNCRGSARYVHRQCLLTWRRSQHAAAAARCQICGSDYDEASICTSSRLAWVLRFPITSGVLGYSGLLLVFAPRSQCHVVASQLMYATAPLPFVDQWHTWEHDAGCLLVSLCSVCAALAKLTDAASVAEQMMAIAWGASAREAIVDLCFLCMKLPFRSFCRSAMRARGIMQADDGGMLAQKLQVAVDEILHWRISAGISQRKACKILSEALHAVQMHRHLQHWSYSNVLAKDIMVKVLRKALSQVPRGIARKWIDLHSDSRYLVETQLRLFEAQSTESAKWQAALMSCLAVGDQQTFFTAGLMTLATSGVLLALGYHQFKSWLTRADNPSGGHKYAQIVFTGIRMLEIMCPIAHGARAITHLSRKLALWI